MESLEERQGAEGLDLGTALELLQTRLCSKAGICGGLEGGIWRVHLNSNFKVLEQS